MRAWLLALISTLFLMTPPAAHAGDVQVVSANFGLFEVSPTGKFAFTRTNVIPLVTGKNYGWVIVLKTDKPSVHWKEEFTLPAPAAVWGTAPDGTQAVSPDRTVSVTEKDVSLAGGPVIFNLWSVADGDPKGHYKIQVTIDNDVQQTFDFDVQ